MDEHEEWRVISEFPNYEVSSLGRIHNRKTDRMMVITFNNFGHSKINLMAPDGTQQTRSVSQLVAEAFVEPPNFRCNAIILLDGDLTNVRASNIAWRPQGFAWNYSRQLKEHQPVYFHNLRVANITEGIEYRSIVEAGMAEGLLFGDIWRSTYTGHPVFPHDSVFEIVEKV